MAGRFRSMPRGCNPSSNRRTWGLRVSLFMDAEPRAMAAAKAVGADRIELYTEPFAAAWGHGGQDVSYSALPWRPRPPWMWGWA